MDIDLCLLWTTLILLGLILGVLIFMFYLIKKISRTLLEGKLQVFARIEKDPRLGTSAAYLTICNLSFNNVNLVSAGFIYNEEKYNFLNCYRTYKEIEKTDEIFVNQRSSLVIKISIEQMINFVTSSKIGKVELYAIDALGRTTQKHSASLTKYLRKYLKHERKYLKDL